MEKEIKRERSSHLKFVVATRFNPIRSVNIRNMPLFKKKQSASSYWRSKKKRSSTVERTATIGSPAKRQLRPVDNDEQQTPAAAAPLPKRKGWFSRFRKPKQTSSKGVSLSLSSTSRGPVPVEADHATSTQTSSVPLSAVVPSEPHQTTEPRTDVAEQRIIGTPQQSYASKNDRDSEKETSTKESESLVEEAHVISDDEGEPSVVDKIDAKHPQEEQVSAPSASSSEHVEASTQAQDKDRIKLQSGADGTQEDDSDDVPVHRITDVDEGDNETRAQTDSAAPTDKSTSDGDDDHGRKSKIPSHDTLKESEEFAQAIDEPGDHDSTPSTQAETISSQSKESSQTSKSKRRKKSSRSSKSSSGPSTLSKAKSSSRGRGSISSKEKKSGKVALGNKKIMEKKSSGRTKAEGKKSSKSWSRDSMKKDHSSNRLKKMKIDGDTSDLKRRKRGPEKMVPSNWQSVFDDHYDVDIPNLDFDDRDDPTSPLDLSYEELDIAHDSLKDGGSDSHCSQESNTTNKHGPDLLNLYSKLSRSDEERDPLSKSMEYWLFGGTISDEAEETDDAQKDVTAVDGNNADASPTPQTQDTEEENDLDEFEDVPVIPELKILRFADEVGKPLEHIHILDSKDDPLACNKLVVLVVAPSVKKFEFVQVEYRLSCSDICVSDVLNQVPGIVTSERFQKKKYTSLLQMRHGGSEMLNCLSLSGCRLERNEVLVAVSDDVAVDDALTGAKTLLMNDKIMTKVSSCKMFALDMNVL